MRFRNHALCFLIAAIILTFQSSGAAFTGPVTIWKAQWIGAEDASKPNTWNCFMKQFELTEKPVSAPTRIACDSKYWLWINGAPVMAVVAGLADPANYAAIKEGFKMMDRPETAMERMRTCYHPMLTDDITTLWEAFQPMFIPGYESIGRGTCQHAWSGGPFTISSQPVSGISPKAPAFREYQILAQLGELISIHTVVPMQFGNIEPTLDRKNGGYRMQLISPPGTRAIIGIPAAELTGGKQVSINGIATIPESSDRKFARFRILPETWKIEVIP